MKIRVPFAPRRGVAVLAFGLVAVPASFAQSADPSLRETFVTATRIDTRADDLVSDVQVIERGTIEASTARSLPELLAREAGMQYGANGGLGKLSSVFVRGTNSRHTILLVDGVRVESATSGAPVWTNIPLEIIERIEVLKGPASALYGSDGVGGVVQVFTRKGREGFHPYASITAGSYGHTSVAVGTQGGRDGLRYSLGVQTLDEKGFSATNSRIGSDFNPDRDGLRQDAFNASLSYDINRDWGLDGSVLYSDGLSRFDDGAGRDARSVQRATVTQASAKGRLSERWQTRVRVKESRDTNAPVVASWPDVVKTRETEWGWENTVQTPAGAVLTGLERRRQAVESTTAYAVNQRTIDAAFAGLNGNRGVSSWQFNLRRDRNSQFGTANTGLAGYGLQLSPQWRLTGSWGTTFVAPSFNDLYYPSSENPSLRPERGNNRELGLAWGRETQQVKLVYFDNRIRDLLLWSDTNQRIENVGKARIEGWTLSWQAQQGAFGLRAALDLLDPLNETNGKQLARRSEQQVTLGADWRMGSWRLGGALLHVGERFNDADNTQVLPAYTTLDVAVTWQFAIDKSLQFKVNNLTDKVYETARGYNQPGRSAFVTLRWQPK